MHLLLLCIPAVQHSLHDLPFGWPAEEGAVSMLEHFWSVSSSSSPSLRPVGQKHHRQHNCRRRHPGTASYVSRPRMRGRTTAAAVDTNVSAMSHEAKHSSKALSQSIGH